MANSRVTLAVINTKLEALTENVQELTYAIRGNGKDGLLTKVDRLEQTEAVRKWTIRALVGSMLTAVGGFVIKSIGGVQ